MKTKSIAIVIAFAAIAISLNAVKIPTLYWPGNFYQISEIPVVIAFLLFGTRIGIFVGLVNLGGQLAFFLLGPSYLVGYPMGFVAMLLMLLGVYLANRVITRKATSETSTHGRKETFYLTAFAVASRGGIMPFIDAGIFYRLLLPMVLGISIPDAFILGMFPFFILFNATVPLYTVPIAHLVAKRVKGYI